jgi:hypothetical protein
MDNYGVLLHWTPVPLEQESSTTVMRLYRNSPSSIPVGAEQGRRMHSPPGAEHEVTIEVKSESGSFLDRNIQMGGKYEYRAQRVARIVVNGVTLEIAGQLSPPVHIETACRAAQAPAQ